MFGIFKRKLENKKFKDRMEKRFRKIAKLKEPLQYLVEILGYCISENGDRWMLCILDRRIYPNPLIPQPTEQAFTMYMNSNFEEWYFPTTNLCFYVDPVFKKGRKFVIDLFSEDLIDYISNTVNSEDFWDEYFKKNNKEESFKESLEEIGNNLINENKEKIMEEKRTLSVSLLRAKEWYKKGGDLAEIAKELYSDVELTGIPRFEDLLESTEDLRGWGSLALEQQYANPKMDDAVRSGKYIVWKTVEAARSALALAKISYLVPYYNNGLSWENTACSTEAHIIEVKGDSFSSSSFQLSPGQRNPLLFKDKETAERFIKEQEELLRDYFFLTDFGFHSIDYYDKLIELPDEPEREFVMIGAIGNGEKVILSSYNRCKNHHSILGKERTSKYLRNTYCDPSYIPTLIESRLPSSDWDWFIVVSVEELKRAVIKGDLKK